MLLPTFSYRIASSIKLRCLLYSPIRHLALIKQHLFWPEWAYLLAVIAIRNSSVQSFQQTEFYLNKDLTKDNLLKAKLILVILTDLMIKLNAFMYHGIVLKVFFCVGLIGNSNKISNEFALKALK